MAMAIHPNAIVEDGAKLGDEVEVGPFCFVGRNAGLADGVRLVSHVAVMGRTEIGARTVVHPGAVLGNEAQIRGGNALDARLVIGEDNIIREGVTMNAGSAKGHGVTKIGARGYFMAACHVGHDCEVGDDVTMANGVLLAGHVEVGDGAIFGGLAAVQQFARIGKGAMLGGLSGANNDVIPYAMAIGMHAKLTGLNVVGLKRRGVTRSGLHQMRAAFQEIFLAEGGSVGERAAAARAKYPDMPQIVEICDFILAPSKRQVCGARSHGHEADDA